MPQSLFFPVLKCGLNCVDTPVVINTSIVNIISSWTEVGGAGLRCISNLLIQRGLSIFFFPVAHAVNTEQITQRISGQTLLPSTYRSWFCSQCSSHWQSLASIHLEYITLVIIDLILKQLWVIHCFQAQMAETRWSYFQRVIMVEYDNSDAKTNKLLLNLTTLYFHYFHLPPT